MKRAFDLVVAGLGLVLAAPVLGLLAVLIVVTIGRPVLFRHQRVGQNFQTFDMLKLRTMADGPASGLTVGGDARIGTVGAWLRRTKLDELPQLWNVLRGDMSLVGPRPEIPRYVDRFRSQYQQVLTVRPGITDEASLRYRQEADLLAQADDPERTYLEQILPHKLELAREYVTTRSLRGDIAILARTVLHRS